MHLPEGRSRFQHQLLLHLDSQVHVVQIDKKPMTRLERRDCDDSQDGRVGCARADLKARPVVGCGSHEEALGRQLHLFAYHPSIQASKGDYLQHHPAQSSDSTGSHTLFL